MTRLLGACAVLLVIAGLAWSAASLLTRPAPSAAFRAWGRPGRKAPGTFEKPRCVGIAPGGDLFVLDLTGRIQRFTPAADFVGQLRMPDISIGRPQGIDVAADGCVYVADTHYNQVVKFDPQTGKIVLRFGSAPAVDGEAKPGEFWWPCAIQVDRDGRIFTAEYGGGDRIQVWNAEGTFLYTFGAFGEEPGQFMRPSGLAFNSQGLLYVADACNHRVQVFEPDGTFIRQWGGRGDEPGRFRYPYDIAIDGADRVYTVEWGSGRVQCFRPDGTPLAAWMPRHPSAEALRQPWGLDVTPDGIVYVADTDNFRVVRVPLAVAPPPGERTARNR